MDNFYNKENVGLELSRNGDFVFYREMDFVVSCLLVDVTFCKLLVL